MLEHQPFAFGIGFEPINRVAVYVEANVKTDIQSEIDDCSRETDAAAVIENLAAGDVAPSKTPRHDRQKVVSCDLNRILRDISVIEIERRLYVFKGRLGVH